jgi:GGDEF domain-containing protein
MAVCGAVILTVIYYRSYAVLPDQAEATTSLEFDRLPLPCVVTDSEGRVLSVSDALLQLAQIPRASAIGAKVTTFLSLDKNDIDMGGKKWQIFQTSMPNEMYCFQLGEVRDVIVTPSSYTEEENSFVDAATSLYTRSYAVKRVEEELYRVRRYQQQMSAALLRMIFQGKNMPAKEDDIFNAYCRFIRSHTRAIDVSCLVGTRDILLILPEMPLDKAEEVIGRLTDFVPHVQEQLTDFDGAAEIQESVAFWGPSSEDTLFDQVLEKLDKALEA